MYQGVILPIFPMAYSFDFSKVSFDIWFWDLPTMVESSFFIRKKSSKFTSPIIVVSRKIHILV